MAQPKLSTSASFTFQILFPQLLACACANFKAILTHHREAKPFSSPDASTGLPANLIFITLEDWLSVPARRSALRLLPLHSCGDTCKVLQSR
jgi:hypothetical protein